MNVVMNIFRVEGFDGMIGLPGFQNAAQFGEFGCDSRGQFDDGLVAGGGTLLGQIADRDAAFAGDFAGIRRFLAEDNGEESGLAGAIGADEADTVLAINLEGNISKKNAV